MAIDRAPVNYVCNWSNRENRTFRPEVAQTMTKVDPEKDDQALEVAPRSFGDDISRFIQQIECLNEAAPVIALLLMEGRKQANATVKEFFETHAESKVEEDSKTKYILPADTYAQGKRLIRKKNTWSNAAVIIPRSFLVSLVSQFDALTGNLARTLFYSKPDLLHATDRMLTYTDLRTFSNIDDATEHIVELEVSSLLRKSHPEQFAWLENKLSTDKKPFTLRKDLEAWPTFVELTQRRHLFVHTDGRISNDYIKVCRENRVEHEPRPVTGDRLHVNHKYFRTAYQCVFEIGVKLGHVLWRKVLPDDLENADGHLNTVIYDLLCAEEWLLAITLGKLSCDVFKKHSSDQMLLFMRINLAQAYKWSGDEVECKRQLDTIDLSARGPEYRIADAVLRDDFDDALQLMKQIDHENSVVNKHSYRDWPLFRKLRHISEFSGVYREVFNEEFEVMQSKDADSADTDAI